MSTLRMGIDIGSVTVKVVMVDAENRHVFSVYRRHRAETRNTLCAILQEAIERLGDVPVSLVITGSAGMGVSERCQIPFVQEVIASAAVVKELYPEARTLIDIGGEDAKLIYFDADGIPDMRMNGACAGGTGAYIDEMAALLNVPVTELSALANQHTQVYPMASRCGVFAKTDVQNMLARQIPRPDIVASILHAVVLQTVTTLARGIELEPKLLFSGGPLTFIPALRTAFVTELGLQPEDVLQAEHMELMPATGAALRASAGQRVICLSDLITLLRISHDLSASENRRLAPLFADEDEWRRWSDARARHRIDRVDMSAVAGEPCFLGIDSGSTTTKIVLADMQGRVVFAHYAGNGGNAIQAAQNGLEQLRACFATCQQPPEIARSAATGYGEDLIRTAFGLDDGIVETVAHFRGAKAFDPDVSFILDIGGQDMKAIFVRDGYIHNIALNEACSAGCGTFIQTLAASLNYSVADFAQQACISTAPCDLGSRCTVFMNSKIKQSLKEAAEVSDISAGLAYSVIKNALHKVLRITDTSTLGEHIVVQGGTFRNPAVQRALEVLLGKEVVCPDIAELMGAYGASLTARDAWLTETCRASRFVGLEELAVAATYEKSAINCRGCENHCGVTKLRFPNGGAFFTGNRCERIYSNQGQRHTHGTSLTDAKLELLFGRKTEPAGPTSLTLGIPRVLNMYRDFPFWNALFVECGFKVQLSDPSSSGLFGRGAGTIMSENICFPAKLVHGHIQNLIEKKVDRIFYPMVFADEEEHCNAANSYQCPIVTGYPDVIDSAMNPLKKHGIPLDKPTVTFRDEKLLRRACREYLQGLGVERKQFERAFSHALAAQREYEEAVRGAGARLLAEARQAGRLVVLLLTRPYHLDPMIHHGVPRILADFGVDVITEDAIPTDGQELVDNRHVPAQWSNINRLYHAAHWAGQQDDVEVVQLNSFGCGPDAFTLDEVKSILDSYGKSHTVIRIDEIESTGSIRLRLRSLIETLRASERPVPVSKPRQTVRPFLAEDRQRTILIPQFSHFQAPVIVGPLLNMGYNLVTLPPPDRESVEIALKHTQNEICYPGIIMIGDVIKALQSGRYDLSQVAIGSWQTGGQCRATSMLSLLRKAMVVAGFQDVPIVALTTNGQLHEQPGNNLNWLEFLPKALMACIYADAISTMYYATAIREVRRGETQELAEALLAPLNRGVMPLDREAVLEKLAAAVAQYNAIPTHDRSFPKVGIVGEIYVKYNGFSNNHTADWLMEQGLEVVMPDFLTFFLSWFVSSDVRVQENLQRRNVAWLVHRALEWGIQKVLNQAQAVMRNFKYHRPGHSARELADKAEETISLTHAYGEGWLIAGEVGAMAEQGVNNVVCLSPFGCIANQIVARGVAKRMKDKYRGLNMLFLDVDAGLSEVNYFNRLHFFASQAKDAAAVVSVGDGHLDLMGAD